MRGVRSSLVTLVVGSLLAASVLAAGWGVQAALLPQPTRASVAAVGAVGWFLRYRRAESELHVVGRPVVTGVCQATRLAGRRPGTVERGTLLRLSDGSTVVAARRWLRLDGVPESPPSALRIVQLELAGCSRLLVPRLVARLRTPGGLQPVERLAGGRKVLALRMPAATEIVLVVDGRTFEPLAVEVRGVHYAGRSRIRLAPLGAPRRRHGAGGGA